MPGRKTARLLVGLSAAMAVLGMAVSAEAQEKKIKIGVIYDLTGPLAGGGSELQYIGAKIMLDQYAKTGVEGYKVEAIYADAQSKPDIAINEAVRLVWGPQPVFVQVPEQGHVETVGLLALLEDRPPVRRRRFRLAGRSPPATARPRCAGSTPADRPGCSASPGRW